VLDEKDLVEHASNVHVFTDARPARTAGALQLVRGRRPGEHKNKVFSHINVVGDGVGLVAWFPHICVTIYDLQRFSATICRIPMGWWVRITWEIGPLAYAAQVATSGRAPHLVLVGW
jgi:hypothetical protein